MRIDRIKFKLADATLRAVERALTKNQIKRLWLEGYQNGRETGYTIRNGYSAISFSEDRHSDDVVVYVGTSFLFSAQGNIPDEKAYRERKSFKTPKLAAEYILSVIKSPS